MKQVKGVKLPNLKVFCKQYFAYLIQVKNSHQKAFTITYYQFFDRTNFFEPNEHFFQKFELSLEVQGAKIKFSENLGHNILELYIMFQCRSDSSQVKGNMISSIANLVYELPNDLPNDLRLRMMMMMMMMMMMNCFCDMVDRRKAFSLISSSDHCQRSSPWRIFDTPRAGFEPVQNLSSGFVE